MNQQQVDKIIEMYQEILSSNLSRYAKLSGLNNEQIKDLAAELLKKLLYIYN